MKYTFALRLLVLAALAKTSVCYAQEGKRKPSPILRAPLSSLQEIQELIRTTRALEAKLLFGLSYQDYSREVGNLAAAVSAVDELP